ANNSFLGIEKGCFVVKNERKEITERFPLFEAEIAEVVLKSGNYVSTSALASMGFWNIDCLVMTQKGNPVAMLRSFDDDSHVETRLCQYEAYKSSKGVSIAKEFVRAKTEGQNVILGKYGLKRHNPIADFLKKTDSDDLDTARRKLLTLEGQYARRYFSQVFQLFPEQLRPEIRRTFGAYDGINNIFNLAYEVLSWRVHVALVKAKLEPYLGFLHSLAWGKPSLICDFQELYRYLIDGFLVEYCQKLKPKSFVLKNENLSRTKKGKREYLNDLSTRDLIANLNRFFSTKIEMPRIRHGRRQEIETLICEEALLFAKYLRNETQTWRPRIAELAD
ncbi:CRISPR-associated endonuclease Cas1, partial [Candidatus Bathyarchaeota archaeon]|nr:CRISPR-associated endonuclease Cas1 [Candidatus Bathyarchaeota archaeon]